MELGNNGTSGSNRVCMSVDSSSETQFSEEIPAALAGQRLDRVVAMIGDISRTHASELIGDSEVAVNGSFVTKSSHRLEENDEVTFVVVSKTELPEAEPSIEISIVYEDVDFVIVNKQPGQVVHPGAGNNSGTIVNGLLARYPEIATVGQVARPGVVHRLDKETTGLFVVARTQRAYDSLTDQLRRRTVSRIYTTLVEQPMSHSKGKVDAPIGRSSKDPTKQSLMADGKLAVTHYSVERNFDSYALVTCKLETGRTHQIRVHMSSIGHPVYGDRKYNATTELADGAIFLHARELSFNHPSDGSVQSFSAELPENLSAVLESLS